MKEEMSMGFFIRTVAIGLVLSLFAGCSGAPKPSIAETEPLLKAFLTAEKAKSCGGTVSVDQMTITRIGDFEDKYSGWPVYAKFSVACVEGSSFSTWANDDTSGNNWVSVVREKYGGGYECYVPELFRQRENELSRQMDRLPTDMVPKTK
jgi:hypothetical protein